MGIRVGNQKDAFCLWIQGARFLQKLRATHLRHMLIDQQECHVLVVEIHLFQLIQCLLARSCLNDTKLVAIFPFQIVRELVQNLGEVINDNDCRLSHRFFSIQTIR